MRLQMLQIMTIMDIYKGKRKDYALFLRQIVI